MRGRLQLRVEHLRQRRHRPVHRRVTVRRDQPAQRQPKRVVPLSTEEIAALIDALPDRYRALVLLASATGLRQGEAFGVTLDRVDFLRRTLVVDRRLVTLAKQPPVLAPPKTKASIRTVPLPEAVV